MDDLSRMLGTLGDTGSTGSLDPEKLGDLARAVQDEGGLDDLVGKLQGAGMGGTVDSWVGSGPNESIDPQRLGAALGEDEVQRLSARSGLDIASLLPLLAAFLPQIINMLTPNGQVPDGGLDQAAQQEMPDIAGMLGGLLGGASGSTGSASAAGLDDLLGGLGGTLGGDKGR
jgi:uncharacterized protein YidB (DUF937 family)